MSSTIEMKPGKFVSIAYGTCTPTALPSVWAWSFAPP